MRQNKQLWENTFEKQTGLKTSYIHKTRRCGYYKATPPDINLHSLTQDEAPVSAQDTASASILQRNSPLSKSDSL